MPMDPQTLPTMGNSDECSTTRMAGTTAAGGKHSHALPQSLRLGHMRW